VLPESHEHDFETIGTYTNDGGHVSVGCGSDSFGVTQIHWAHVDRDPEAEERLRRHREALTSQPFEHHRETAMAFWAAEAAR
jgi:hypothetical protein